MPVIHECQLQELITTGQPPSRPEYLRQRVLKLFRKSLPKKYIFLGNRLKRRLGLIPFQACLPSPVELKTGDLVRVKSRKHIFATLDSRNKLGQLTFDEKMWQFCGTTQRVFKVVQLENVICDGKIALGKCDRCCYFFGESNGSRRLSRRAPELRRE